MKGYPTSMGYMGLVNGAYILFASEEEYREYLEDGFSHRRSTSIYLSIWLKMAVSFTHPSCL